MRCPSYLVPRASTRDEEEDDEEDVFFESDDYDDLTFSGENEELLAHLTSDMLVAAGWTILAAIDCGDVKVATPGAPLTMPAVK